MSNQPPNHDNPMRDAADPDLEILEMMRINMERDEQEAAAEAATQAPPELDVMIEIGDPDSRTACRAGP